MPDLTSNSIERGGLSPSEREVEAALASLRPAGAPVDASDAMFEAGRRSGAKRSRRQVIVWRSAAAVLLLVGVGGQVLRGGAKIVERERVVYVAGPNGQSPHDAATLPTPAVVASPAEYAAQNDAPRPGGLDPESILALRTTVLDRGVDALPAPTFPVRASFNLRGMLSH